MTAIGAQDSQQDNLRQVDLSRQRKARYVATNPRGGTVEVGEGDDSVFTPVELLLVAIAACSAMDVDYIVGKRADADSGTVRSSARKVRDALGNRLVDLEVAFDLRYPDGEAGDAARAALPTAIQRSNERLCTVSRTVQIGTPVRSAPVASSGRA
jgi:uncharacterized OsmC-like protein